MLEKTHLIYTHFHTPRWLIEKLTKSNEKVIILNGKQL